MNEHHDLMPLEALYDGHHAMGRTTIYVTCPFCHAETEVYIWSFRGSGKRCRCGALMTIYGARR